MAFVNLPPNLQDIFYSITDRVAKLETGPNQAMYTAEAAQGSAASAQSVATNAQLQAIQASNEANAAASQATIAQSQATIASTQAVLSQKTADGKNTVYYSIYTAGTAFSLISNAVGNGTNVVYTAYNDFYVGESITVISGNPSGINITANVVASNFTSFTLANTWTGTYVSGGSASRTVAPTYVVGDIWYQVGTTNSQIFNQWIWSGSSWVSKQITNTVIANLDAGKITTGTLSAIQIQAGSGNPSFTVSPSGYMTAIGATIIGNITADSGTFNGRVNATSGYFGTATNGWEIGSQGITGVGSATITGGSITGTNLTGSNISGTTVTGGTVRTSVGYDAVILNGASNAIQFQANSNIVGNMVPLNIAGTTYGVLMHYGATADPSGNTYPQSYVGSGAAQIAYSSGIYVSCYAGGVVMGAAAQSITMANDTYVNGELYASGYSTTANAANAYIFTTGGRIARSTASSERYKENITNLRDVPELDPKKLLDIPVRAFSYKPNYLKDDDRTGILIPGLIAEEVDAIYPLAADYADGNIENINDRAILVNLLALVQDLYKEIELLKLPTTE